MIHLIWDISADVEGHGEDERPVISNDEEPPVSMSLNDYIARLATDIEFLGKHMRDIEKQMAEAGLLEADRAALRSVNLEAILVRLEVGSKEAHRGKRDNTQAGGHPRHDVVVTAPSSSGVTRISVVVEDLHEAERAPTESTYGPTRTNVGPVKTNGPTPTNGGPIQPPPVTHYAYRFPCAVDREGSMTGGWLPADGDCPPGSSRWRLIR